MVKNRQSGRGLAPNWHQSNAVAAESQLGATPLLRVLLQKMPMTSPCDSYSSLLFLGPVAEPNSPAITIEPCAFNQTEGSLRAAFHICRQAPRVRSHRCFVRLSRTSKERNALCPCVPTLLAASLPPSRALGSACGADPHKYAGEGSSLPSAICAYRILELLPLIKCVQHLSNPLIGDMNVFGGIPCQLQ